MKEVIEIPLSRNKLILLLLGSLLFVLAGLWLFLNANQFQDISLTFLRNPLIIKAIGLLGMIFFGAAAETAIGKLREKKAGLRIDQYGITDHSSASAVGLIEWADISGFRRKQVMSRKFLLIDLTDPEKYLQKTKSGRKSRLLRANKRMYGTPLSISTVDLKCNFSELDDLLQKEFRKNKSQPKQ